MLCRWHLIDRWVAKERWREVSQRRRLVIWKEEDWLTVWQTRKQTDIGDHKKKVKEADWSWEAERCQTPPLREKHNDRKRRTGTLSQAHRQNPGSTGVQYKNTQILGVTPVLHTFYSIPSLGKFVCAVVCVRNSETERQRMRFIETLETKWHLAIAGQTPNLLSLVFSQGMLLSSARRIWNNG